MKKESIKNKHGGSRPGSGPKIVKNRPYNLSVRISPEINSILSSVENKSDYIEEAILNYSQEKTH